MRISLAIARRELSSYFISPIAYVVMTLFLLVCGFYVMRDFQQGQPAGLHAVFDAMIWLLMVCVPLLSMGLIAHERAAGTLETLMTAPIRESQVVLGKFLGAMGFLLVLLLPTAIYVASLKLYSAVDLGPIFGGYLGVLLAGALFAAIGLLCSAATRSQFVAAIVALAILFAITAVPLALMQQASTIGPSWLAIAEQGVYGRYQTFNAGIVDSAHVVFFTATTSCFLFLSVKVLESRRWR